MRILVYWEQESWGGVDTHLLELLRTWPDRDDEIVLLVNEGNLGFDRLKDCFESLPHVRCESFRSYSHNELSRRLRASGWPRFLSRLLHFAQPLTYFVSVRRLHKTFCRLGAFDLLLADNGGYPAAWGTISAIEAGARAGIRARLLLIHHSAKPPAAFMGMFERMVDSRLMRFASSVVCVSHATRGELLRHRWIDEAAVRIRVIHNGISPDDRLSPQAAADIRSRIGINDDVRLIGIVGRIDPYKGHEDLIFALARLASEQRGRLHLVVLGSPGAEDEIPRLQRIAYNLGVESNVKFLGYVEGKPVDLIAQLDLLVVATRSFEGFGLTLIEAMSVGVPVLATRVGAIPEFVHEGNGVLVRPASPLELAVALADFIDDPLPWQKRAEVARKELDAQRVSMADEYRRLFLECLASADRCDASQCMS